MWGCNHNVSPPTCMIMVGGQYTSQTDCYLYSNCTPASTGFYVCKPGGRPNTPQDASDFGGKSAANLAAVPCYCVWDPVATSGHANMADCANASNCCSCNPPPGGCPPNTTWSPTLCYCTSIIIIQDMVDGEQTPCVQTEDCESGWHWDWEHCTCISNNQYGDSSGGGYN